MIIKKFRGRYIGFCIVAYLLFPFFVAASIDKKTLYKKNTNTITICIDFKEAKPNDTLWLVIDNIIFPNPLKKPLGIYAVKGNLGQFRFIIPVSAKCGYWDLYKNRTFSATGSETNKMCIMHQYFWEKGDNIKVKLSNKEKEVGAGIESYCTFSGAGSTKYSVRSLIESVFEKTRIPYNREFDDHLNFHPFDTVLTIKALDTLAKYRKRISTLSYGVLKADIIFHYTGVLGRIHDFYDKNIANASDSIKARFVNVYQGRFRNPVKRAISLEALNESANYISFLYSKFKVDSYILHQGYDPNWIVSSILSNTNGVIRDKVVMMAIISLQKVDQLDVLYTRLGKIMKDENCRKMLAELVAHAPGRPFTTFDLPDINGKRIRLTDFKGKLVLIDFWFNGCGYCQVFYKNTLSKIEKDFEGNDNVVFVSINGDMGKSRWLAGIKEGVYTSNRAVNVFTDGQGFKHPVILKNNINGFPFVVLINKKGIIENRNSLDLYDYGKLYKAIKALE